MPIDLTDTITRLLTLDVVCSSSWNFQSLIHVIYRRAVLNTHHLQPKFVVSRRLQFSKGFWVFLFCPWNHLSGGGVHANHNAMHLPCFTRKNKTANDSKLLNNSKGNRDGEWNFCRWEGARHCFIHISGVDIHEKDKKKVFEPNESIIAWNRTITETNKMDENPPITNHYPFELIQVNICFLTERSAKMIDGTEKPKIPSKFAKWAVRNTVKLAVKCTL